nr:DUF4381 domain-containing protein [uncultured Roseococcus sp.]
MILPSPISLWAATPAWYVLGALILLVLLGLSWLGWRAWRRRAYRREALRELEAAQAPAEIAIVLKRTALAAWPRASVASLTGAEWASWLRASAPRARLTEAMAQRLAELAYLPVMPPGAKDAARNWIRRHDLRA